MSRAQDPRKMRLVGVSLLLASMAVLGSATGACGAPDTSAAPAGDNPSGDGTSDPLAPKVPDGGTAEVPGASADGAAPQPENPEMEAGPVVFCEADDAVFDLTQMGPTSAMPQAFIDAWEREVGTAPPPVLPPGTPPPAAEFYPPFLALAGKNLRTGPLDIRLGPVEGDLAGLKLATTGTAKLDMSSYKPGTSLSWSRTPLALQIAFGVPGARRLVDVRAVAFNFVFEPSCSALTGTLDLEIPESSGSTQFGTSTLAEVLGPMNADADFNGAPDGWTLSFASNRADVARSQNISQ
jgi:hypothetical protein